MKAKCINDLILISILKAPGKPALNDKYVLILREPDTNRKSNSYLVLTSMYIANIDKSENEKRKHWCHVIHLYTSVLPHKNKIKQLMWFDIQGK